MHNISCILKKYLTDNEFNEKKNKIYNNSEES